MPDRSEGLATRARLTAFGASAVLIVVGCGGNEPDGGAAEPQKTAAAGAAPGVPDNDDLIAIAPAFSGIATGCLGPAVDEQLLSTHADTLIAEYQEAGSDAADKPFKLTPAGTNVTLRGLLEDSAKQLRNCDQAAKTQTGGEIADRIDAALG